MSEMTPRPRWHLLVAEDNPADRTLLVQLMNRDEERFALHFVRDGVEAMDYLYRRGAFRESPRPNLIFLDLNLARKDGREVLTEIKRDECLARIPVVVLTTSGNQQDVDHAYALSASCFVTKPGDLDEYVRLLRSIEEFWLKQVKLPMV